MEPSGDRDPSWAWKEAWVDAPQGLKDQMGSGCRKWFVQLSHRGPGYLDVQ